VEKTYDYIVIGGGIVGVSTAWQLQARHPSAKVALFEKESQLAYHQTGHNSGVIHAGVYYPPQSLKAEFCKRGVEATIDFCRQHQIDVENCGKLLVATTEVEVERMHDLYARCQRNGVEVELLDRDALCQREPNIQGLGAIAVKTTSIVDYTQVTRAMAEEFCQAGGELHLNTSVSGLKETTENVKIEVNGSDTIQACFLIACSGLAADRMTQMMGLETHFQIIPYRGEYYRLAAKHNQLVKHLIYPIPDPELPFLGIHLTRMIDGSITVGPNAVQGFKREGYDRVNFSLKDSVEMLLFPGFWKVTLRYFKTGISELRSSWFKASYLKKVNKYCPKIKLEDLEYYPAGVRAQAVLDDGTLVHDFLFAESERSLHVCNAPSPAATSAIPIGEYVCQKVEAKLEIKPTAQK
jgi:L-2-hydroxyglutarate oxidase